VEFARFVVLSENDDCAWRSSDPADDEML
jgi:hypothetical protein